MSSITELTLSAHRPAPAENLRQIAAQCEVLGITCYDTYGDTALSTSQSWLRNFEAEVASTLGLLEGVFMCSGIMAQDIALAYYGDIFDRTSAGRRSFVCHYSSHILLHEQEAYSSLLNFDAIVIPKDLSRQAQEPVTYGSIAPLLDSIPRPACVILECPHREIGGKLTPWEDLVEISEHCRRVGIPLHMDGARLWEAAVGYGRPFPEICALFDSVYVSLYKGLGGLTGAMLLGGSSFIAEARVWQRRFGGMVYTQVPYAISCWHSFREHRDSFAWRLQRMQEVVAIISTITALESECSSAAPLVRFDPPVPQVSLVHAYFRCTSEDANHAKNAAVAECGVSCFTRIRGTGDDGTPYIEFNMGPLNGAIADDVWRVAWACFLKHLRFLTPL